MKFYRIDDQIVISDKMLSVGKEVVANTTDGAHEKHVPVITVSGDEVKVAVGSVEHPSLEAHYIEWILLVTETGMQMKWLKPGMKPEATFKVTDKPVAAYEYCNLHGLWMAEV
jgi:superoxide reductase